MSGTAVATTVAITSASQVSSAGPAIWMLIMMACFVPWYFAIQKWPNHFWPLVNVLSWVGVLAFMLLTNAESWLLIGSIAWAACAIPLSFFFNSSVKQK